MHQTTGQNNSSDLDQCSNPLPQKSFVQANRKYRKIITDVDLVHSLERYCALELESNERAFATE